MILSNPASHLINFEKQGVRIMESIKDSEWGNMFLSSFHVQYKQRKVYCIPSGG